MNLSILIPARDPDPVLLDAALRSAIGLAGSGHVILVDDGSARSLDLGALSPHVQLVRSAMPLGVSAARNLALDRAASDLVLFLDADDRLLHAGCMAMIDLLDRTAAVAVVAARYERRGGVSRLRPVPDEWIDSTLPLPGDVFHPIALFGGSGLLVRRGVQAGDLRFDPALEIGEDRDFLFRAAQRGPIAISGEPALVVTLHDRAGANLTADHRLERRIRDHLTLMARHLDSANAHHFRGATRWLINRAAHAGVSDAAWSGLLGAARAHGWPIAFKSRLRRRFA